MRMSVLVPWPMGVGVTAMRVGVATTMRRRLVVIVAVRRARVEDVPHSTPRLGSPAVR